MVKKIQLNKKYVNGKSHRDISSIFEGPMLTSCPLHDDPEGNLAGLCIKTEVDTFLAETLVSSASCEPQV